MTEHQGPTGETLELWVARVSTALDLPESFTVDIAAILDLARDAAHGVARPAAPLTTFLVGYAAAQQGGGEETVRRLSERVAALALGEPGTASPGTPDR
ncbi:MAG: hypothetical protein RI885_1545 [Actinomycetota bacterium]|jgi:hydrogenase/urease accessory protein HupE